MFNKSLLSLALASALLASGCSLAPTYERPAAPIAADWSKDAPATGKRSIDNTPWRDKRARQALSLAMDRPNLLKALDQTGKGDAHSHIAASLAPYWMSPLNSTGCSCWKTRPIASCATTARRSRASGVLMTRISR